MAGHLIHSVILQGASALIRAHGRKPAPIARASGVPVAALDDPELMIPARAVLRFFERAAQVCGNRNWGLELAAHARLAAIIGPLWILLRNARTVQEMCEDMAGNFDLYSHAALMSFQPLRGGAGLMSWSTRAGVTDSEVQMAEFALSLFCAEIRTHCTPDWMPQAVLFRHAAPARLHLHRQRFGDDLRFDQNHNGLLLDAATLARPLQARAVRARSLVRGVLRMHEETGEAGAAHRVERILRALMPFAPCALRDVALAMGLPERTLQAQLQREGQGFQAIKDGVRADLALKYLQHSRMSAGQIADVLGYTDPTSFSRSFRRWHGQSARRARTQARSRPG